jgi:hypothetical protein
LRAALDIARKTKGVSEEVLSRCIDELAAAEEEVEGTRRDEARLGSLLKTESSSLIEIQKRSMQVRNTSTLFIFCLLSLSLSLSVC